MNLELKNIKIVEKMSEETTCFHGDLYVDGVRVAHVENTGKGGCNRYVWNSREIQVKVEAWAKAQPLDFDFEHLDQLLGKQIMVYQVTQDYKKMCRKKLVWRLASHKPAVFSQLKGGDTPAARKWVMDKYGKEVLGFVNDDPGKWAKLDVAAMTPKKG